MTGYVLERTQVVPVPLEAAFAFFSDARNLERITPPWLRFRIVEAPDALGLGARLRYRLSAVRDPDPLAHRDRRVEPAARLRRRAAARSVPALGAHASPPPVEGGTEIYDHVRYRLFLGPLGGLVRRLLVRGWVEGIFDYRAERGPGPAHPAPAGPPRRTA